MAITLGSAYGKVAIDASGVKKGISQAKEEMGDFEKRTQDGMKLVGKVVAGLTVTVFTLKKAFDFGKEGAQIDIMRDKFDTMANSIGTDGNALFQDLKKATRGLLTDADLVAAAYDMMSLGLAKTHDEAVRLATVSGLLGMNMNQLVLTLTNQTTMRFDALGLSVDGFDEKVKKLEDTGIAANEAFKLAFLEQAEEKLRLVGDVAETDAGKIQRMEVALANLEDQAKLMAAGPVADFAGQATSVIDYYGRLITVTSKLRQAVKAGTLTQEEYNKAMRDLSKGQILLADAEQMVLDQETAIYDERRESIELAEAATKSTVAAAKAAEEAALAEEHLQRAMSDLDAVVNGKLGPALRDHIEDQEELREKAEELRGEIAKLEGEKYLTNEQKEQLAGLKGDLEEVEGQITANADAHGEATKRILFDILTQRAAIDGLTQAEYEALLGVAEHYGLIDEATATAMRAADEFFGGLQEDAEVSIQDIQQLDMAMRGLPTLHNFTVKVNVVQRGVIYTEEGEPVAPLPPGGPLEPGQVIGGARGLHGFIPPGFPNDSFLLAATSGERVDITPRGAAGGGGEVTVYQYFANAGAAALGMAYVESLRAKRLDASMGR